MRTTIELKDEHRARLLELAARRGEKGFSHLIAEAVDLYLHTIDEREEARERALELRGSLSEETGSALRERTRALRRSWR